MLNLEIRKKNKKDNNEAFYDIYQLIAPQIKS